MLSRIVVPLDGSQFAEHALAYALVEARRMGACLELALVHSSYSVATMDATIHETIGRWQEEQRQRESSYVHGLAERLEREHGVPVRAALLTGPVPAALARYISGGADLVVMTTHGRGGLERAWLGSVADAVIRHVHVPVLLVRPNDHEPEPTEERPLFRHLVVALDGSAQGEHALESALAVADADTRITLMRVIAPPVLPTSMYLPHEAVLNHQIREEREREAAAYLARMEAKVRPTHARVDSCVLTDTHAGAAIVRWAESQGADGIGVSQHVRSPALRLLLGSVAQDVIRGGSVPVLVG